MDPMWQSLKTLAKNKKNVFLNWSPISHQKGAFPGWETTKASVIWASTVVAVPTVAVVVVVAAVASVVVVVAVAKAGIDAAPDRG